MEIRWLEDFIALARTRHFSRAAEEQNVTQPTFSRRIKMLEEEMGVQLIDRNSLPLSLTPAGEIFLESAREITELLADTRERCQQIRQRQENRLVFATSQTLYLCLYKSWVEPFCARQEVDVELNLKSTAWEPRDFVQALLQKRCDLMMYYWHPALDIAGDLGRNEFEFVRLCDEKLVPYSVPDESGRPRYALPGSRRRPLPFIDYHHGAPLKPVVSASLQARSQPPFLTTVNTNFHSVSIKAMIKEGFGVGWIPSRLAQEAEQFGKLVRAGGPEWDIPVEIRLYRWKENHNVNLARFWAGLQDRKVVQPVMPAAG
ncbi:LysR family transcriptional regulator [Hahella sp. SMD15-11]|uniref:LysR family transcriptional regulator n=1 Tax=Thermohahella caldifontis TaxID=3142973 RepID=A0AB39UWR5_9GAMM